MNKKVTSQTELIAYQLEELYDGEKKLQHAIQALLESEDSYSFKEDLQKFERQCSEARIKIKRVLSYLMIDPFEPKNNTFIGFTNDFQKMMSCVQDSQDRHKLATNMIKRINSYKLSAYEFVRGISHKMDQDQVDCLLNEIIEGIIECDGQLQKMQNHNL